MSWVSNGRPRWDWSGGNSASEPLSGPGPCCYLGGLGSSIMGRDPLLGLVPVLYPAQPQKAKTAIFLIFKKNKNFKNICLF